MSQNYKDTDPQETQEWLESIDDALEELKNTNEELGNVKNKAGKFFACINGRGSDIKIADPLPLKKYRLKNRLCEFSLTHSKDKRNNLVTEIDLNTQKIIVENIYKTYPNHAGG